ncbi:hypothetical protein BGW80DRAFT_1290389 [Lactifluus volemus]|nr:hypothetical protein BGW80DRAFT_1290389 [Lactifluus volemus]
MWCLADSQYRLAQNSFVSTYCYLWITDKFRMKFARYLDNAQAPEWKRAYIDYRGLKKRITAIRQDKESSIGNYVNVSPGASSGRAGPSTGHSHGLVDGGHEADDETNMQYENQKRLRVVDTRDDQIELKGLNRKAGGSSRLEAWRLSTRILPREHPWSLNRILPSPQWRWRYNHPP